MATLIEISRQSFFGSIPGTAEDINNGCLQRIALATELMAQNYLQMQKDLKYYKDGYIARAEVMHKKDRTITALRGVITKLKNKAK